MPARFPLSAALPFVLFAVAGLAVACSGGDATAPTPTPDPALAGRWEYAGYQVDGKSITVFVRLLAPGKVEATLDNSPASRAEGGESGGIHKFTFENVAPGRHVLRITDAGGTAHIRAVWMPAASSPELGPQERITLKPGDGFKVKGADFTVLYTGTLGDSRCPVDVTCIRAGDTTHSFTGYAKGAPAIETVIVAPNGSAGGEVMLKYLVTVHTVSPEPRTGVQPDFSKYQVEASYAVGE